MRSSGAAGSRSLRLVNILLTLCWALMLARLYQKYAAAADGPAARAAAAPGAASRAQQSLASTAAATGIAAGAGAAAAGRLDADGLPLMWKQRAYFPSKAAPATGAAAGPAALAPLRGRCFYFVVPDRTIKVEWCFDDHVQQVRMPVYQSMDSGWFTGWHKEGGKFVHQVFEGGEKCGNGFDFPRSTQVHLRCAPDAQGTLYSAMSRGVDLIEFKELDVCKYSLTVGLREWCEVEKEQGALPAPAA
jgi:hypothetical protein